MLLFLNQPSDRSALSLDSGQRGVCLDFLPARDSFGSPVSLPESRKLLLGDRRTYPLGTWDPGVSFPNSPQTNQGSELASHLGLSFMVDCVHHVTVGLKATRWPSAGLMDMQRAFCVGWALRKLACV